MLWADEGPADTATPAVQCRHFFGPLGRYHELQLKVREKTLAMVTVLGSRTACMGALVLLTAKISLPSPPAQCPVLCQHPASSIPVSGAARRLASSMHLIPH